MGDAHVLVPVVEEAERFRGIARSNETAAFIVDCLKVSQAGVRAFCL